MRNHLATWTVLLAVAATTCGGPLPSAHAQSADEIAASVPLHVSEVLSGGQWQFNGATGVYRAVTLLVPEQNSVQAVVYVQWIGAKDQNSPFETLKNMAIPDVTDRKLPDARIALEAETENEATIIVSGIDAKTQKPLVLAYKATKIGMIVPTNVPEAYKLAPDAPAAKK